MSQELKLIAQCEICGGGGVVDSGGQLPWGEAALEKCGHCDGTGKEPPPEELCQLFEMCELQGIHPELKAAVAALILRCMDAEIKLRRLPANWFEDSSLETWFPLTARKTTQLERTNAALLGALKTAEGIVWCYCERNPKWDYEGAQQDPLGAHKALDTIRAAIAEAKSQKENGNGWVDQQ